MNNPTNSAGSLHLHLADALARWRDPDAPLATGDDAADVAVAIVALATARAAEVVA